MALLHIAHRTDWEAAERSGTYEISTRGATLDEVGFIHASHEDQVARVAGFIYRDDPEDLVVLVLDAEAVERGGVDIREEDGGDGEIFPHLYGAIRSAWVTEVRPARFEGDTFVW